MLILSPIEECDRNALQGTSYDTMSNEQWSRLLSESMRKVHEKNYFEFYKLLDDNRIVGFMNLYAHSAHIISCGPTIKLPYRRSGYAYQGEIMALSIAKSKGYTIAVGGVDEDNSASRGLHEKLGFELERIYTNAQGRKICLYIKAL